MAQSSFDECPDERLRQIMCSLTGHLHVFVKDVGLTEEEWGTAIELLTRTGHITDDKRQDLSGYFRRLARPAASARQPRA